MTGCVVEVQELIVDLPVKISHSQSQTPEDTDA